MESIYLLRDRLQVRVLSGSPTYSVKYGYVARDHGCRIAWVTRVALVYAAPDFWPSTCLRQMLLHDRADALVACQPEICRAGGVET